MDRVTIQGLSMRIVLVSVDQAPRGWRVPLVLVLFLNAWVAGVASQTGSTQPKVISVPQGEVSRIPSPDGKWPLTVECPNNCSERKLWIEEASKHQRKRVKEYERSLDTAWA